MIILGLTGSIAMGKSAAAHAFRFLGVPVHDADACVHDLLGPGGAAVAAVAAVFPDTQSGDHIDRQALAAKVFKRDDESSAALKVLEDILHPLVRQDERTFLGFHARARTKVVLLDIPLLFETGAENRCDAVVVVSAGRMVQRQRALRRFAMTTERFETILCHQTPDLIKRRHADFVVNTGGTKGAALRQIKKIVTIAKTLPAHHWPPSP